MQNQLKPELIEERQGLWNVFLEGEKVKKIHRSIFGKQPKMPSAITREEWDELFEELEYKRVKNYLVWRLSKQSYHSDMLKKILLEKFVSPETVEKTLGELSNLGLLNDREWVRSFIQSQKKRMGMKQILFKLRQKGLSAESIEEIQEGGQDEDEEGEGDGGDESSNESHVVLKLLKTKYRTKNLEDFNEKRKVIASLMRKGFKYESIQEAFKEYLLSQKED